MPARKLCYKPAQNEDFAANEKKKKKERSEVHIQSWYLRLLQVRAVCQCLVWQ